MSSRLALLAPEMFLFGAAVVLSILGLSRSRSRRALVGPLAILSLVIAGVLSIVTFDLQKAESAGLLLPSLAMWLRPMVAFIAAGLMAISGDFVDQSLEASIAKSAAAFSPLRAVRGEFCAFALFSVTGVMLLATATDLIWLFLALELVSLPTYVMVAIARGDRPGLEAAVKYFFLGAMATGFLLYGFALLYGATGTMQLDDLRDIALAQLATGESSLLLVTGIVLSIVGLCFKITAVPMHFYAPDVYEGAPLPVTAFLSFIPKVAGFTALILLLSCIGLGTTGLPRSVVAVLWMMSLLTMTLGNIGALLQHSMKRTMAYSSIAHSGYMLVALVAGSHDAIDALLFYLFAYGVTTTATFGGLACIQRAGLDADRFEDLAGLRRTHPWATAMIALGALSFTGIPPLLGFFGKFWILVSAFEAGQVVLVGAVVLNSVVSAWYYLRFAATPIITEPAGRSSDVGQNTSRWPVAASIVFGCALVVLPVFVGPLMKSVQESTAAPVVVVETPLRQR
ncbi:MAG: NADH-quinone oxidoreductase subunit N [Planctomycetota bacterium]|nr:NADH-quinone oxidoreductase subunit N [Planctomycetota bacterium]